MPAEYMSCHVMSCQRRHAVPLRPIWTIMAAAKLDQNKVLVTKFRQNRLTLKGRSAHQRHTLADRHTDRQTPVKIMALQVCNRANRRTTTAYIVLAWHHVRSKNQIRKSLFERCAHMTSPLLSNRSAAGTAT